MNMVFLGLAAIVLLAGIGTYLYYFIKRIFKTFKAPADKLPVRVIIIVLSVICGVCSVNIFSLPAMIIYHIVALSMAVMLINFIIKKLSKEKYETMNVWKKIYGSGIIAFGITAVIFIYGHYNMMHVVQTDYTIYTDKEIRKEGYRAALIADVHFSVSVDLNTLKEKCDEISSNNVDMVFLCVDIVDENTS